METCLEVPQGSYQLQRLPLRKLELLQAWDAADCYLLEHLAGAAPPLNTSIVILNDSFGALGVALHDYSPLASSDSYLSQQSSRHNLVLNGLAAEQLTLLSSLETPAGEIDYLLIKVPKTLALLEYQLLCLRPLLRPDSKVIVAGMVKNLPASVWKLLERLIGPTTTSLAVKKARLIFTQLDPAIPLPDNPYPSSYILENSAYRIYNHANVFSRDSLDIGSRFLLQHLPNNPDYHDFIDLGCGNGVIGLMLAAKQPQARLTFVDESYMALASARQNFTAAFAERTADFVLDDCLSSFAPAAADCIICNPPFHQQHTIGDHIAWQMFKQAYRVLRPGGELRVIGNRHLNYPASLKKLYGNCQVLAGNDKFVIMRALKR